MRLWEDGPHKRRFLYQERRAAPLGCIESHPVRTLLLQPGAVCSFVLKEIETEREEKVGNSHTEAKLGALTLEGTHSNYTSTLGSVKLFQGVV